MTVFRKSIRGASVVHMHSNRLFINILHCQGPGMVINNELKNVMRSHHDLEKDNTPYLKKATRVNLLLGYLIS